MKTIKQIADEIGVTKASLQKRIGRDSLSDRLSPYMSTREGTKYIDETGESILKEVFERKPPVKPIDMTGIDTGTDGHTRDSMPDNMVDLLNKQMEVLQQQLEIKDKQIEDLNLRLAESNAALVSAQQTVQAEQALHAGTIQSRLLTDGKEKGGLWSKIFKKKER